MKRLNDQLQRCVEQGQYRRQASHVNILLKWLLTINAPTLSITLVFILINAVLFNTIILLYKHFKLVDLPGCVLTLHV